MLLSAQAKLWHKCFWVCQEQMGLCLIKHPARPSMDAHVSLYQGWTHEVQCQVRQVGNRLTSLVMLERWTPNSSTNGLPVAAVCCQVVPNLVQPRTLVN